MPKSHYRTNIAELLVKKCLVPFSPSNTLFVDRKGQNVHRDYEILQKEKEVLLQMTLLKKKKNKTTIFDLDKAAHIKTPVYLSHEDWLLKMLEVKSD